MSTPVEQTGPQPRAETDPGSTGRPDPGAPILWIKEYSAVLLLLAALVAVWVDLREQIRDRPTRVEVKEVVREAISVHSLTPHPGVSASITDVIDLKTRFKIFDHRLTETEEMLKQFFIDRDERIRRGGGTQGRNRRGR